MVSIDDLTACDWLVLSTLVLLAAAGLYYLYTLLRGYRCLPLTTTDCPGGKPHFLVYVNSFELGELAKIAGHTGKPCHGIDSYPKRKEPSIEPVHPEDDTKDAYEEVCKKRRSNARARRRYDIMSNYWSTGRKLDVKTPFVDDIQAPQTNPPWSPKLA